MKNRDTWEFAHKFNGKIWFISGLILLPASVAALSLLIKRVGFESAILIVAGAQLVPILGSIIVTEAALRIKFDKSGERKK